MDAARNKSLVPPAAEQGVPAEKAIPVISVYTPGLSKVNPGVKMTKLVILMKQSRFEAFKQAMNDIEVTGMTVTQVLGCGTQKGRTEYYRGTPTEFNLLPKVQVDIVVSKVPVQTVVDATKKVLYTGHIGDGKIFIYDVENVIKIRTGEEGYDALQGESDC